LESRVQKLYSLSGLKMSNDPKLKRVLAIVGPTAVGKTDLAIQLTKRINGEIISADSRLFYRGMDIGTAKPTKNQLAEVPHHLINCADPHEVWSLAIYRAKVIECIEEIFSRKKIPIIVGGTGQYVRAVTEGWVLPAQQPDDRMRKILQDWAEEIGGMELYNKLKLIDPDAAREIDPTNLRRTVRALEVIFLTGKRFSELRSKESPKYNFWIIGLIRPRSELYERIDLRIEEMFKQGLVAETQSLIDQGLSPENPNLSAIGYREVSSYLRHQISLEDAKREMKKKTRDFVRRQRNWFKPDDPEIHWHEMSDQVLEVIIEELRIGNIINEQ
jgi:tRNA dimethylallyltransferase